MADNPFAAQLKKLGKILDSRSSKHKKLESYYTGNCPVPQAITDAKLTNAYRQLMPMSSAAWGSLVVDSTQDRLEVAGVKDADDTVSEAAWGIWQDNQMDSESKLGHNAALLDGRVFALVWDESGKGQPEITLDDCTQMAVQFKEGSRRHRVAAMRRWVDDDKVPHARLYLPNSIEAFKGPKDVGMQSVDWEYLPDEKLDNPLKTVPVVELGVNRRLKPGGFPFACGEYENHTGLIDQIHLLTFLGLVVALWMGFPLRGLIGDKIARKILVDDDGQPILDDAGEKQTEVLPPFEPKPDSIFQIENPEGKIVEFKAADRKNLSIYTELSHLAMLTKTPRHYFPQDGGLSNVAADTIRAEEGALHAKVTGHKAFLGEGWEETLRLGGLMLKPAVQLSQRAELEWMDHEFRSLGERADAASKLKDVLPPLAVAELALNVTDEQWRRWEAADASGTLTQLVRTAQQPANGVPVGVGAGA